jgi:hypothetical protein
MGLNSVYIPPEPVKKGGGGFFGSLATGLGGIVSLAGLAAAPFTGGASAGLGTALGGALTGAGAAGKAVDAGMKIASVGNLVGGIVDPAQPATGGNPRSGGNIIETAAGKKLQQDPQAMVAQLNEGINALKGSSQRTQQVLMPFYESARANLMKTIG